MTLRELREHVTIPKKEGRVPSWKQLQESESRIVVREIVKESKITVYENGFVVYESGGYKTVFPFPENIGYEYDSVTDWNGRMIPADILEDENWYILLSLIGEDRLKDNTDRWYRKHSVSYHAVTDEWDEMVDVHSTLDDELIAMRDEEEFWDCISLLTEKQRFVMIRRLIYNDSYVRIAKHMGISAQGARDLMQNALKALRKRYGIR